MSRLFEPFPIYSAFRTLSSEVTPKNLMSSQDMYFPPPTQGIPTIWRNKQVLVMTKEAALPARCVKCNAPTNNRLKRQLRWHHPALYLVIIVGVLFYFILALVISKSATVHVGFCEEHAAARKRGFLITLGLVLLSLAGFVYGAANESPAILLVSLAVFLGSLIFGIVRARVVAPQKIDDQYVWLTGVNGEYLQQFPEWVEAK